MLVSSYLFHLEHIVKGNKNLSLNCCLHLPVYYFFCLFFFSQFVIINSIHPFNLMLIRASSMQDDYAVHSFERGIAAQDAGAFAWEITPVR